MHLARRVVGVVLTVGMAALAAPDAGFGAPVLATIERGACFGTCPIYSVTVRSDGTVEYEGRGFVKLAGHATAKLSARELEALRAAFRQADYFTLDEKYDCYEITDAPTAVTSFHDAGLEHSVSHYYGCPRAPAKLSQLEARIDAIVHVEKWVGSRGERSKMR
jgi:hypothetical protein